MSGNFCAFPGCNLPIVESVGTITGEICHIKAKSAGGPRFDRDQTEVDRNDFDNLVLLCRRHHKVVDSEPNVYSVETLQEIKAIHERTVGRPEQANDTFFAKLLLNDLRKIEINQNSGSIVIDSPGAIVAKTVNVRTTRKTVAINAPPGTIGADQQASRYIQHLISRYNEFASADKTRGTKFSYGVISRNIETNFRAPWKLVAMEEFGALCIYLQQRISKTRIAKINAGKGHRAFSSFEEFCRESH